MGFENKYPMNSAKYLLILESLKFQDEDTNGTSQTSEDRFKFNVTYLQNFLKNDFSTILRLNAEMLDFPNILINANKQSIEQTYVVLLQHVLLVIEANTNFNSEAKEDLISTKHLNLFIEALQDIETLALRHQLHEAFYENGIFGAFINSQSNEIPHFAEYLRFSIEFFDKMLGIKQFHVSNSMELVIRDYMAAIFTVYITHNTDESILKRLQRKLDSVWLRISKMEYFRNLMLFKGFSKLPIQLQKKLHQEMLQKLGSKDGFTTLVAVLQSSVNQSKESRPQQTFEIISNIVAFHGHTQRFQTVMIQQIFAFFDVCLRNDAMMQCMGAGLLTLRRMYDLNAENAKLTTELAYEPLNKLSKPIDVLSGLIVMDHKEFCKLISLLYQLFYTSAVECLPSKLLIMYIPMLLELYYNLPDAFVQKQQIAEIVSRCLHNLDIKDLQEIVYKLYVRRFDDDWQQLHDRIMISPNAAHTEVCFKISGADYKSEFSISLALPSLLMKTNNTIITYHIFMALLELMSSSILDAEDSTLDIDLLQSEEELITLLNSKYPVKIEIILSLNTLISFQPFKSQIEENSREFLKFMRKILEQRIDNQISKSNIESTDQILLIMLTLMQELLENSQVPEEHRDFLPALMRLHNQSPNFLIQQRTKTLITLLSGEMKANAAQQSTAFNMARTLLESQESHLQVYGIQILLDLLRKRDPVTLTNGHVIIALALTTLKHKESYTFLNCVRLFVTLVNVMEAEVLEILSDEYLNENSSIDFRLVVGEAILKVSQELGPLCYKYKDVMLNMFMHGARSQVNEFRMSSFANLAQLCRTLCYQVLTFFQELLHLIDCELCTGKYLPSKRAALLVLSELLDGIDNLMDFEELLLPVYRLLKLIAASETSDTQMRVHATNGLKALSDKCKKFLFPEEELRKEIRIFGIKDKTNSGNKKKHILEIS